MNTKWLVEKFRQRFGRDPHMADLDEQADICAQQMRHEFDPLAEACVRCGKTRDHVHAQRDRGNSPRVIIKAEGMKMMSDDSGPQEFEPVVLPRSQRKVKMPSGAAVPLGDYSSFADEPLSLGEIRASKQHSCTAQTPRDALISVLRRIDKGDLSPTDIVVCYYNSERQVGGFEAGGSGGGMVAIGMLEKVKREF